MNTQAKKQTVIARSRKATKQSIVAVFLAALLLAACGDDNKNAGGTVEDGEVIAIADKTVSGVSQKGPFVNGSSVTVQELDGETLAQTGNSYEGKIKNDMGEFSVKVTKLASQYALLKANGFYRNEVSGEKSKSQVTLYALTDLSNRDEVNVNLLTHLAYERSLYLASDDSVTVTAAKKRSEKEVLASFGMDVDFSNAEDLNIFGKGDESAALLAVSILMQGDLNEADFSERLADYAADIETDGKWDDAKTATDIADWAAAKSLSQNLPYIRKKMADWGLSADVPAFEKYVDNFWWENYGLGKCSTECEGEVLKNANSLSRNFKNYFICENGAWRVAYDTEYDTYQQECDEDGKIVYGNVNKDYAYECDVNRWRHASNVEASLGGCIENRFGEVAPYQEIHYICENRQWRIATDIEKDTYKWIDQNGKITEKDGDVRYGDVVKTNCYVFENGVWRSGNANDCSLGLRGCTNLRQDTVGLGSDKVWHICDDKSWRNATTYEKDTFGWKDSTDGVIKKGNVTDSIYVFDKTAWRATSNVEGKLGGCVSAIADSVGKAGSTYYICKSNKWVEASAIEYDTYRWAAGKDGDSKVGSVNASNCYVFEDKAWRSGNASDCSLGLRGCTALRQDTVGKGSDKVWHICDTKSWRNATNIEMDTATWGLDYKDGNSRYGRINEKLCYVFESENWRYGNENDCSLGFGGCIASIQDSIFEAKDGKWYACDERMFRLATENEIKAGLACTNHSQGEFRILKGQYSYYKCESGGWNFTTEKLNRGTMIDERDGKVYKTIGIKSQMWMAENLNYRYLEKTSTLDSSSYCYNNDPKNCEKYGRRYLFSAAIDSTSLAKQGYDCGNGSNNNCDISYIKKGVCPDGWHIPGYNSSLSFYDEIYEFMYNLTGLDPKTISWNDEEEQYAYYNNNIGRKLRSKTGYRFGLDENGGWTYSKSNGTDEYGFDLRPCNDEGDACSQLFWGSSICGSTCVNMLTYSCDYNNCYNVFYTGDPGNLYDPKTYMEYGESYDISMLNATAPVRCIKDEE